MNSLRKIGLGFGVLIILATIVGAGFAIGYRTGQLRPQNIVIDEVKNLANGKPEAVDFSSFWQAWSLLNEMHIEAPEIDSQEKVYGAIKGLVGSLKDPYTEFFNPVDNKKFQEDVNGSFSGIGAEIGMKKEQLVVVAPLKNSPAMQAGILAGDFILKVNASSTDGLSVDEAVRWIRGPQDTKVVLTIFREGFQVPKDIEIIRDIIETPTLEYEMKEGNIAYIRLQSFNANANKLFYESMLKALSGGAKGLVLDLRNNPGGYLEVAVDLAGWFLPKGTVVVSEDSRIHTKVEFKATGNEALVDFPVVVLINQGSASASEILAGALHDQRKTKLIGEKSFGKGTVQQIVELKDRSSLKVTVAHWVLPSGKILEHGGIEPDIEVKPSEEDIEEGKDVQLLKAIEVLKTEIK